MTIRIERLYGENLGKGIASVARLRISVFREWPYLYDGDLAYEEHYLSCFAAGRGSVIVAAIDGSTIVGAATGSALHEHTEDFVPLFAQHGYAPERIFYCGEFVLLPGYRGQGLGHAFFDHCEAHARELRHRFGYNFAHSSFCSVIRDSDDKRCPLGYRPLDGFWQKRGYTKIKGMTGSYDWREIGAADETSKKMQFWIRALD